MTNFNGSVGNGQIGNILQSGSISPLQDVYEIESLIFAIKEIQKQIESHKILRDKRILAIDSEINKLKNKIDFLKSVIHATLKHHNQRALKFPGVASVSQRKPKVTYEILDQDSLAETLKKENEYDNIFEETKSVSIKKHELNKLLSIWDKNGKLEKCNYIAKHEDDDSITLSYDSDIDDSSLEKKDDNIKLTVQNVVDLEF